MSVRKQYSPEFKSKIVLEILKEEKTLSQLSSEYGVHTTQLKNWKKNERDRYENAAVVQALAGTSPVLFQSGKYRFARQRKSCVKPFSVFSWWLSSTGNVISPVIKMSRL
jgi:transposase-like protein